MDMHAVTIPLMICVTLILPFAFVVALVWIRASARNRQFAQIMEERKLMIERGMEPPKLELPGDPTSDPARDRDRLANLKAGIILLGIAVAILVGTLFVSEGEFLGGKHFGTPAGVICAVLGLAFILIHLIARRHESEAEPTEPGDAEEVQ